MSQELEKYEIDVQALMRGLVHELRNPLSAILTASSLLHTGENLDEESQMLLGVVQKESHRMNRILTEFSQFVKPAAPRVETFDIAQLMRELITELKQDSVFRADTHIEDKLPKQLMVTGDPHHVGQALRHILKNSAESIESTGQISLSGNSKDENVYLEIADDGKGLQGDASQRAFQPFFSTKPAATGLGLSIARMALRASGGDATIENCGAQGACVYVLLPASTSASVESLDDQTDSLEHAVKALTRHETTKVAV